MPIALSGRRGTGSGVGSEWTDGVEPRGGKYGGGDPRGSGAKFAQEKLLRDSMKRRLQLEVVELAWESGSPLSVLQSLARLAQGGVAVDPAVYHLSDLAGQALPGQSLRETTLHAALQQILAPRQLQYRVEPGYLEIDPLGGDERGSNVSTTALQTLLAAMLRGRNGCWHRSLAW